MACCRGNQRTANFKSVSSLKRPIAVMFFCRVSEGCWRCVASPVSQQGQGVTGGLLLSSRDVGGPGSERWGSLSGLDAVKPLRKETHKPVILQVTKVTTKIYCCIWRIFVQCWRAVRDILIRSARTHLRKHSIHVWYTGLLELAWQHVWGRNTLVLVHCIISLCDICISAIACVISCTQSFECECVRNSATNELLKTF